MLGLTAMNTSSLEIRLKECVRSAPEEPMPTSTIYSSIELAKNPHYRTAASIVGGNSDSIPAIEVNTRFGL